MAGRALPRVISELAKSAPSTPTTDRARELVEVRTVAAKMYGQGFERKQIAKMLIDHLAPNKVYPDGLEKPMEQRLIRARALLRRWELTEEFRDLIYHLAVVKLDLQTPAILEGVARKAKRGRVDAARLALEITGRHNPKGDQTPTQVAIVFNGIPRPDTAQAVEAIEIEASEVMVEPDNEV